PATLRARGSRWSSRARRWPRPSPSRSAQPRRPSRSTARSQPARGGRSPRCQVQRDVPRWKGTARRTYPEEEPVTDDRFEVRHEPERSRYVLLDGEAEIGEERYLDVDGADRPERILHHTLVTEEYEGQGLASRLVQEVVEDTIAAGRAVVPVCPYVARWMTKHSEFAAHVIEPTPEHRAALKASHP